MMQAKAVRFIVDQQFTILEILALFCLVIAAVVAAIVGSIVLLIVSIGFVIFHSIKTIRRLIFKD